MSRYNGKREKRDLEERNKNNNESLLSMIIEIERDFLTKSETLPFLLPLVEYFGELRNEE